MMIPDLSFGDIVNGSAGVAALYLAFQIKATLSRVVDVQNDHGKRIARLEAAKSRRKRTAI